MSVKTQCESKNVIARFAVKSSLVSVAIVIVRIRRFPFSYNYPYDAYELV